MLNEALDLLKEKLNNYIKARTNTTEDKVTYIDGSKTEPITFPLNQITLKVINIEEERTMRPPDPYYSVVRNGVRQEINPEIRIGLLVMFVSRFKDYGSGLYYLSQIIRFFQANRYFDHQNSPDISPEIDNLFVELMSVPLAEQNELWHALRATYLPSVAYRVRMLVFKDRERVEIGRRTETVVTGYDLTNKLEDKE